MNSLKVEFIRLTFDQSVSIYGFDFVERCYVYFVLFKLGVNKTLCERRGNQPFTLRERISIIIFLLTQVGYRPLNIMFFVCETLVMILHSRVIYVCVCAHGV